MLFCLLPSLAQAVKAQVPKPPFGLLWGMKKQRVRQVMLNMPNLMPNPKVHEEPNVLRFYSKKEVMQTFVVCKFTSGELYEVEYEILDPVGRVVNRAGLDRMIDMFSKSYRFRPHYAVVRRPCLVYDGTKWKQRAKCVTLEFTWRTGLGSTTVHATKNSCNITTRLE
jgi:hypothetical protein